jgi:CspA family cold shock protein
MTEQRETGFVKWFNHDKGYGFIASDTGPDVFVHINDIEKAGFDTVSEGQQVSFIRSDTPKGPQAEALQIEHARQEQRGKKRARKGKWKPDTDTDFEFGSGYLANGYFEDEKDTVVYPEVVDEWAIEVAKLLGNKKLSGSNKRMSEHQLRRFFNRARAISDELQRGKSFQAVRSEIYSLKSEAARAVARNVAPEEFKEFIDLNIGLATENAQSFQEGFVEHFQHVFRYYTYYFRDS